MRGRVLVELGLLAEAEAEVERVLELQPSSLDGRSLLAKIKHLQGELTQTIAAWAEIHARSPHPSHAPGDVELERALALFREHRPAEARAFCAALAEARRGDPQRYKRAVIAGAWFAEACGDTEAARVQLEELGKTRGFEHDHQRLFALLRIYDHVGTPEALESAARICRHVLADCERRGVERLSVLGHLAALERRAGRIDRADELDARLLQAMRRRMHRATLDDLVRVAAREYLPIARLAAVRRAGDRVPSRLDRRELALAEALAGDRDRAREGFAHGDEPLDAAYLADLAALDGDDERATELYLAALRDGLSPSSEPAIAGWLLDRHTRAPAPAIAEHWADEGRHARTLDALRSLGRVAPQRPDTWRHIAALLELAGRRDEARRPAARARALAGQDTSIGRVLAAGVYHFDGKPKGLLHEIWVRRTPTTPGAGGTLPADEIHGNITSELRAAIRNSFVAVREYARARFPDMTADLDDYTYSYKLPKEDEQSGGMSAGLPSALAFLSVFLQRPVARGIASSGALITEAHDVIAIGRIGEAEYKVKAAYHGNLQTLILPLANRAELEKSAQIPLAITNEIVCCAADLDQAVKLAFGADVLAPI